METSSARKSTTKTHRRLRKAYCRLLCEKNADQISVSSLCKEADVSRATFYLYYQNIDEFKEDAEKYTISLFIKQIEIFLESGKTKAALGCKKRNLIFTDDDFELFYCLFSKNRGFGFDEKVLNFAFSMFYKQSSSKFSKRFFEKNKAKFDLFYIGYASVMRENFLDYHSDKVYRDILRTIEIWDYLFPDYKFTD